MSQKYDDSRDSVRFYVDGTEKKAVQMVPDWNKVQIIFEWWGLDNRENNKNYTIFTAPSDGYITVYDCANTSDYYLKINGEPSESEKTPVYHKCMYTESANGFFMIAKGDCIKMHVHNPDTVKASYSRTIISYIPGKITE